ncbi:SDR family oxidoreductase [Erythrobacter sp. THAF29]|uniref:SDR family oxidoreductase n=1 Tax=Erythrobacter sp. THAF29 TaxID=2587851 RepID=UPI0012683916|nr:SDR family oxidoreductase [Erythrobacter sp. THAF29]QFT76224.1 3-beta-hydroxysteroid dehydrogenase [Erythrobacter sp. THAF29]
MVGQIKGRVEGRIALVTGGAMGLGKADCERLAEEGAKVIVTDREVEEAHRVADSIGGDAMALDVTDEQQWKDVMHAVEERHGGLDILVNNAGNVIFENIEECPLDHFKLHLDIHVVGTFLGCKYALPLMKHRHKVNGGNGASIINMASTAALMGYPMIPAYTAAKGGISAMTRSIAVHCQDEGYGIRCNALAPGGIETPMVREVSGRSGEELMQIRDGPLDADALGAPKDIAGCVLFLASDDARFINGVTLPVDNGLDARPHH